MSVSSVNKPRRVAYAVLGGCVAVVLTLVILVISWRTRLNRSVEAQLGALRAAGLPTSGAELNSWYAPVPDEQNTALVLAQAFVLLRNYPDQRSNEVARLKLPPRGQHLSPEQKELLAGYVEMNTPALAKAREALALPKSRFPIDLSNGPGSLLPHLAKIRALSSVANVDANLAKEVGRDGETSARIADLAGLARTLDQEPMLLSQLVRASLLKMACSTLERSLNFGAIKDVDLEKLGDTFRASERTNLMARALIGERALAIPCFRMSFAEMQRYSQSEDGGGEAPVGLSLPGKQPWFFRATGFFERDLNFFLRSMDTNIALLSLGPPRSLESTNFSEQASVEARRRYCILSSMLLPSSSRVSSREADLLARLRMARTALAVERFRLANGRTPTSPTELVPQFLPGVPLDPFVGEPLRYRQLPQGYVVYSVGPDGRDDGGKEPPTKNAGRAGVPQDITFTVER